MTFRIPEIKFLQASPSAIRASKAPGRKKVYHAMRKSGSNDTFREPLFNREGDLDFRP
ncbi:hypothetical protein LTR91_000415 [Friedmanniomyces endolithicus]|uniref:Uncharacterized protein n=1 Tax=Friedmanniomyces endolithicus TaxID=329885 RepID=A0AAN6R328_9PEZI|nr:hypothetical protein LTR35_010037 [Friedmanniomyces endolithicus]KAK0298255.1 hypothetical protein LTS00_003220 [Friedmanniomyces endolithicus]KAK0313677.1 hypothetical protein LTR01_001934 [Friedmanniomyces endolithicus]KAK0830468.1 hypothetical protein LTR73_003747 [Friedmanniomyces endolithicus]KAK1010741.1 hypothetical protein LTS01_001433 [Friedmanniomyces endolithicus]